MKLAIVLVFLTATLVVAPHLRAQEPINAPQTANELLPPLMRAAEAGNLSDVQRLLKDGANVNEDFGTIGITALMLAAARGHLEVVKVLLKAGADPNATGGATHVRFLHTSHYGDDST